MLESKPYTLDEARYTALSEGQPIRFGSLLPGLTKERLVWVPTGSENGAVIANGYLFDVLVLADVRFSL